MATVHGSERHVCGRVTVWEPAEHYAQEFRLGHDDHAATLLDVRFTGRDGGTSTLVHLEHSGWTAGSERVRETYADWDRLLARYAAFVS